METVVIALEELAHYAESTARTMPVTGVVPRAVAEDQIRHALRALREKRRAAGCVGTRRRRTLAARQSLAVRAGGKCRARRVPCRRAAPHHVRGGARPRALPGAARLRRRARGRGAPRRISGRLPAKNAAYRTRAGPSRRIAARGGPRPACAALPGRYAVRRVGRRIFHSAAAHCLARSGRGAGRGRRRGAHPPARPGGGVPAHGRAQPPGLPRARRNAFAAEK